MIFNGLDLCLTFTFIYALMRLNTHVLNCVLNQMKLCFFVYQNPHAISEISMCVYKEFNVITLLEIS